MDSANKLTWVELTGSDSVEIDASKAAVIASIVSGEKAAFEKFLISSQWSAGRVFYERRRTMPKIKRTTARHWELLR
jgi:hypothetical protein